MLPSGPTITHRNRGNPQGFTLLEVLFVVVITVVLMTVVVNSFARYSRERSAQQAAYLLSRDLRLARAAAIGSRRPVSLVVLPGSRSYVIRDRRGVEIARRTFATGNDITIESLTLGLTGDSVTFSSQGVAALTGVTGGLAEAVVRSSSQDYVVRFNATGSSRIVER